MTGTQSKVIDLYPASVRVNRLVRDVSEETTCRLSMGYASPRDGDEENAVLMRLTYEEFLEDGDTHTQVLSCQVVLKILLDAPVKSLAEGELQRHLADAWPDVRNVASFAAKLVDTDIHDIPIFIRPDQVRLVDGPDNQRQ